MWSDPLNLSNSPSSSSHPAIVADAHGIIHVFWSENIGNELMSPDALSVLGNAIVYRRWDGEDWTEPVDVLAVPDDPIADFVAAAVDDKDHLHVVWTGLTRIYYSSAKTAEATIVTGWSKPRVISEESARSRYESDVLVDARGDVHILYATRGAEAGIFHYVEASSEGTTASVPLRISSPLRAGEVSFKDVRLASDDAGRLHATWGTANDNGYSQAVYYARRESVSRSWEPPIMLADATGNTGFTGDFPVLIAENVKDLLLIHVDESNIGRIERKSSDGGATWDPPRLVLQRMEGVNGFVIPLIDAQGDKHLVINMRPSATQEVGIYYAPRSGLDWAPVIPVAIDELSSSSAHYTQAEIRLGNEIHVVWTQLGTAEVWYTRGQIPNVTALAAVPIPTDADIAVPMLPMVVDAEVSPSAEEEAVAPLLSAVALEPPDNWQGLPVLVAFIASILVLTPVTALFLKRTRS